MTLKTDQYPTWGADCARLCCSPPSSPAKGAPRVWERWPKQLVDWRAALLSDSFPSHFDRFFDRKGETVVESLAGFSIIAILSSQSAALVDERGVVLLGRGQMKTRRRKLFVQLADPLRSTKRERGAVSSAVGTVTALSQLS